MSLVTTCFFDLSKSQLLDQLNPNFLLKKNDSFIYKENLTRTQILIKRIPYIIGSFLNQTVESSPRIDNEYRHPLIIIVKSV